MLFVKWPKYETELRYTRFHPGDQLYGPTVQDLELETVALTTC